MYLPAQDVDVAFSPLEPRNGVTSDFDNPPNHNGQVLISIFILAAFSVLLDLLRSYWKMWLRRKKTWPCLAFAISEVLGLCALVLFCVSVNELYQFTQSPGYDVHTWNLRMSELVGSLEFQRVYECLALAILACIKIAIHLEDCQALVNGTTIRRLFWRASIFIILIMSISTLVTIVLVNRRPYDHSNIGEFWKRKPRRDLFTSMIISGAIQLPTDLLMIALPQFVLWRLRSGWRKKLKAVLVLGSGVIPCTVGFVSLILTVIYSGRADSVWYIRRLELLKNAEMACWLVIRAAKCIPQIIWAHESVEGQESATDIPRQPSSKEFGLEGGLAGAGSKEVLWDPTLSKG
ncbi:hypothetical protein H9L39_17027 [Fusarium oxysporum f. sp. albedinis]|nr:hypothetical protein H9L39_17027 [Fusarium oxysporum f. sp. albedinis]